MPDRKRVPFLSSLLGALAVAGCITVHVYFPVKELKEAADEIVEEVRPEIAGTEDPPPGSEGEEPAGQEDAVDHRRRHATGPAQHARALPAGSALFSVSIITASRAEEKEKEADEKETDESDKVISASSPKIRKIKATLKARYRKLLPLYAAGRIGEGLEGYLVVREVKDLGLEERRDVNTLVKAENADRENLYTTIARENKIPDEKIKDIGRIFSRSWQKSSKSGWWIEVERDKKRLWVKKPKEPEETRKASAAEKPASSA